MLRSLTIVIALFCAFAIWTVYSPEELQEPVSVTIEKGMTVDDILQELTKAGVIDNTLFAKAYVQAKGIASGLQAGEYTFKDAVSLASVLNRLSEPQEVEEVTLTFIEGWTIDDMAEYVSSIEDISISDDAFRLAASRRYDYFFLEELPNPRDLEGYLFPDTYRVFKDITAEELVRKMLETFAENLTEDDLNAIEDSGRTLDETVILASILERELLTLEERKLGADVFLKRLRDGIGLQADSTVNYITKKKTPRATFEDLEVDSPYNTYKYRGLPPGPISNPGHDSLQAAIYPTKNRYYFFLTTPDGDAIFSETLEEHNQAKAEHY